MKHSQSFSQIAQKITAVVIFALSLAFASGVASASKRVALVIGNSAYLNTVPLKNPRNDAEDLSLKLKQLGFDVVGGFDLDSRGMRDKVREFGNKLRGADVAMFFYAGHALQVNGRNYLAPVNTDIRHEGDLDFETIPMDFVQRQMERETKTVLLFLDACRDNPLARNLRPSSRSTGSVRGLARETESSEGTFIAFATQPNNVALDGDGRNSPFTAALLANIERPGVEISTLMTDVRQQVFETTKEQQIPWINSSLLGRFYFKGGENDGEGKLVASLTDQAQTSTDVTPAVEPVQKTEIEPPITSFPRSEEKSENDKLLSMRQEQLAWEAVKDSTDIDELRAFVKSYGNGFFGDLAILRLAKIEKQAGELKTANLDKSEVSRKIQVEKVIRDSPEEDTKIASVETPASAVENEPEVVTREITRDIQGQLNRIGCVVGKADGLWGKKSIRGLGAYAKHAKVRLVTLQPTHDLLIQLKTYDSRICPAPKVIRKQVKTCKAGQKLSRKGNCYWPKVKQAVTCKPGQKLSRKGNCYWPEVKQTVTCQPGQKLSRKGNCYWPKVKQVVTCQPGQRLSSNGNCYWPQQPQQQVLREPPPQVLREPPPRVISPQPQPQPQQGLLGGAISGIVGGVILHCATSNSC